MAEDLIVAYDYFILPKLKIVAGHSLSYQRHIATPIMSLQRDTNAKR